VTRRAPGMIDFRVLRQWQNEPSDPSGELYAARWLGPHSKWCVVEIATGKKLHEGMDKKAAMLEARRLEAGGQSHG